MNQFFENHKKYSYILAGWKRNGDDWQMIFHQGTKENILSSYHE